MKNVLPTLSIFTNTMGRDVDIISGLKECNIGITSREATKRGI